MVSDQNTYKERTTESDRKSPVFRFEVCRPDPAKRRIGWLCSYTPEELIMAAGFVPYRLSGGIGHTADSMDLLPVNLCPYVRKILNAALGKQYGELSGMVFVYSCDAMRRLADIWKVYLNRGFHYCLDVPRRNDKLAENFLVEQLHAFKSFIEGHTGRQIRNDDILQAIETLNHTRNLMDRISQLRHLTPPAISGSEFNAIALCGMKADKVRFNMEAHRFLNAFDTTTADRKEKPRVLLCGCVIDDVALPKFIEACECTIVADDHCTGIRHYHGLVETEIEPIKAIARRYLMRHACSRMTGAGARIRQVLKQVKDYRADGVIFYTLKFCDLVQADLPRLNEALQREGIPLLPIDLERFDAVGGQIKTRVEAFIELLKEV